MKYSISYFRFIITGLILILDTFQLTNVMNYIPFRKTAPFNIYIYNRIIRILILIILFNIYISFPIFLKKKQILLYVLKENLH